MIKERILYFVKGLAMGAADVIPGVSGGTIALITGIYPKLISSISNLDINFFKNLLKLRLKKSWYHVNGQFIVPLLAGIGLSILLFSKLILFLLENYDKQVWGFFFGLIASSTYLVSKQIKSWKASTWIVLIIGSVASFWITTLTPANGQDLSLTYIFLCGSFAICAMLLPGVSGSFILVLMGSYTTVINSIKSIQELLTNKSTGVWEDVKVFLCFGLGCLTGLVLFSKIIKWAITKYESLVLALMTGFLVGSLNKVWPWKASTNYADSSQLRNISPFGYEETTGEPSKLTYVICFALLAISLVIGLDWWAERNKSKTTN